MTFDGGQAVVMTLPHLLTQALRKITGTDTARYVFPLGAWWIETAGEKDNVIATFATDEGFEVSFAIPREGCGGLGWALGQEAKSSLSPDDVNWLEEIHDNVRLN
jgi:hypothetical protein